MVVIVNYWVNGVPIGPLRAGHGPRVHAPTALFEKPASCSRYSDWATGYTIRASKPSWGKKFFSSVIRSDRLWGPPSLLFSGYRGYLSGVKRPGPEVDHSSVSRAEVKNKWSYTSAPRTCLHSL